MAEHSSTFYGVIHAAGNLATSSAFQNFLGPKIADWAVNHELIHAPHLADVFNATGGFVEEKLGALIGRFIDPELADVFGDILGQAFGATAQAIEDRLKHGDGDVKIPVSWMEDFQKDARERVQRCPQKDLKKLTIRLAAELVVLQNIFGAAHADTKKKAHHMSADAVWQIVKRDISAGGKAINAGTRYPLAAFAGILRGLNRPLPPRTQSAARTTAARRRKP